MDTQTIAPLLTLVAMLGLNSSAWSQEAGKPLPFYIGTYTSGNSQGIYRSSLNRQTGEMDRPVLVAELDNASFLTIHPRQPVLYAVSEIAGGGPGEDKQVSAYAIEADGSLRWLGGRSAAGDIPCYVTITASGKYALVANYGSGNVLCYPLQADGRLGEATSNVQHVGKSVNPQRQEGPHAHCIVMDPSDRFAIAADLGTDEVVIHRLDQATGKLTNTGKPLKVPAGSGPRHFTFHPNGRHAFVINELASTLMALEWDAGQGELKILQTVSTLPSTFSDGNSTAEVLVHPNGRFVYGSNRGHHSLAVFAFDEKSGMLTAAGHVSTEGETPRNFRIDPSGAVVLAENQDTHTIVPFRVDLETGMLTKLAAPLVIDSPVCIKFYDR